MSEGNQVRIAIRKTGAVTPWVVLRRTGDALSLTSSAIKADDVRADRLRSGQKTSVIKAGGTVDFNLSAAEYDDLIAAAMCNTWTIDTPTTGTDQIKVGTTDVTFDVLKSYMDTGNHVLFTGMFVSKFSLSMQAAQKVTGQVEFMGQGGNTAYDPSGDTFAAQSDALFFDSSNNISSVTINGAPIAGTCITGLDLSIDNGFKQDQCIGSLYENQYKGSANITTKKTIKATQAGYAIWQKTITSTPIASSFTVGDGVNTYKFDIPVEYVTGALPSGGLDSILSFSLDGTLAAASSGDMLTIQRT